MKINYHFVTKLLVGFCLSSFVLLFTQCKKDEIISNQNVTETSGLPSANLIAATSAPTGAYNIQNALPAGYVKDGSRDYTSYIQNAINKYSEIAFPGFPIMVNDAGLKIGSNKRITFLNGSEIRLKPSSKSGYNIIDIRSVTNVTLVDPVITGDRAKHIGTSGEWGNGISIYSSSNVTITNPRVFDCWGDGIYLGRSGNTISKNITITNAYVRNNRRDGITIISVDGLKLENPYAGFTNGVSPMAGIDIEPNSNSDKINNIVITNPRTESNTRYGIAVSLSKLYGAGNQNIGTITIENHNDYRSGGALYTTAYIYKRSGSETISGTINVVSPFWRQNVNNPVFIGMTELNLQLNIYNPKIENTSGTILSEAEVKALIFKDRSNYLLSFSTLASVAVAPSSTSGSVVFAVNAGGSEFTASNGIKYLSDRNFTGGRTYKTSNSISNTSDDALYQSERFGNFAYAIPVSNGTYEVTVKLAEVYQAVSNKRRFDVRFEGVEQISNLDIFAVADKNNAYDLVKTVDVTDGTLNIQFNTDIDNAKVSAFHVVKK